MFEDVYNDNVLDNDYFYDEDLDELDKDTYKEMNELLSELE